MQPNVKPQPEEDGAETISSPTIATSGVSSVQVTCSKPPPSIQSICIQEVPVHFETLSHHTKLSEHTLLTI